MQDRRDNKEIHELKAMLTNHMETENIEIKELLNEIKALREEVKPLIEIYTNSLGAYKTITWFLKLAAVVAAGIGALIFLRNKW